MLRAGLTLQYARSATDALLKTRRVARSRLLMITRLAAQRVSYACSGATSLGNTSRGRSSDDRRSLTVTGIGGIIEMGRQW